MAGSTVALAAGQPTRRPAGQGHGLSWRWPCSRLDPRPARARRVGLGGNGDRSSDIPLGAGRGTRRVSPGRESRRAVKPALGQPRRLLPRDERRRTLIAAATRAFSRSGFAGTSLDDVADEAGVSRILLYRHFESKTHLYRALLDDIR